MSDVTLKNGREINLDLESITWSEYLGLFDVNESDERSDKTIAKAAGLDYKKEYCKLSLADCKRITEALIKKAREPLADPNLPSVSI
jgi:hypothetical protein